MKVIFVSGTFNVIHPGHQRLLRFAKSLGSKLVVGLISDKLLNDKSYINEKFRMEGIRSLSHVDKAILIKKDVEHYIKILKPDIIVKGGDYTPDTIVGKDLAEVIVFDYVDGYSTSRIIKNISNR